MPHPSIAANAGARPHAQRGMTLIELLVGITIGLMVVAVAGAALMVSRGVSGTVSDASDINQQASYAMRVIGSQLRQTASLRLNLNPANANAVNAPAAKVAFERAAQASGSGNAFDLSAAQIQTIVSGTDLSATTGATLTIGYQRYPDPVFESATPISQARNCMGGPADANSDQRVESLFRFDAADNELECAGNTTPASANPVFQPIINHVANFRVRYLVQSASMPGATLGDPTVQYLQAAAVTNWGAVQGIEVCLVLYGAETIDLPTGSSYTDCDGTTSINMTTLTGARRNRMHKVYRNVFQLRSQGLLGTVL